MSKKQKELCTLIEFILIFLEVDLLKYIFVAKLINKSLLKLVSDDNVLVEKLSKGDVEAFDLLYEKYSGKLYSFGLKYLRSVDEAEELVQSVFLKLWENYRILKTETSFKSYIFTIAYNEICNLFRKRSYQQKFIHETLYENAHSSSETEESIDYQSDLDRVTKIIETLTERQRTIFLKSRYEGKSTKEIANELNLSPGTVDNYISSTLKLIRSKLHIDNLNMMLILMFFIIQI